jgi:hypothetical protein
VLDLHTIKPIDVDAIMESGERNRRIITVEDHNVYSGRGSAWPTSSPLRAKAACSRNWACRRILHRRLSGRPAPLLQNGRRRHRRGDREVMKMDFEADEDWEDEI